MAAAYASMDPCQSRWSSATLRTTPTSGRQLGAQCSWKLDSSAASTSTRGSASSTSVTGSPMFPHARAAMPASRQIASSIEVVVVFPLVPVTASHVRRGPNNSAASARHASSTSPHTGTPDSTAATNNGESGRHPGLVTTSPTELRPSPTASSSAARSRSTPSHATPSGSASRRRAIASGRESATTGSAPSASRMRTAPGPDTPAPRTSTRAPPSSRTSRSRAAAAPAEWVVSVIPLTPPSSRASRRRTARSPGHRRWPPVARNGSSPSSRPTRRSRSGGGSASCGTGVGRWCGTRPPG